MPEESSSPATLVDDLMQAWQEKVLHDPPPSTPHRFGDIYLAPLGKFADGAEHFGMERRAV